MSVELKDGVTKGRIEEILLFEVIGKLSGAEVTDDVTAQGK